MSLTIVSLRDEFDIPVAAGSVNGTLATDGVNARTVIDSSSMISISSGKLNLLQSNANWHNISYPIQSRVAGRVVLVRTTIGSGVWGGQYGFASANGQNGTDSYGVKLENSGIMKANDIVVGAWLSGEYVIAVAMRAAGLFYFVNGVLRYISNAGSNNLYPLMAGQSSDGVRNVDSIRVASYWLPIPIVSDGFSGNGTSDGLGHAETSGIGSGGSGVAWTQQVGTWTVSGGKVQASALSGGIAIATAASSTVDQFVGLDITRSAGEIGVVLRYTDASNYIRAVHNGTNLQVIKKVAGTDTTVINAAATYSVGKKIWIWTNGTAIRAYFNDALIGSATISDSVLQSGVVGIYTSDTGNTGDNFVAYAVGTGGEYNSELQIVLSNERSSSMAMTDSLLKVPVKILTDILSLSDSVLRTVIKSEAVQMALSSSVVRVVTRAATDVLSLSSSVLRTVIKSETVQMALDSTATKIVIKVFSSGISFARSQAINYGKRIIRIIRLLGSTGAN